VIEDVRAAATLDAVAPMVVSRMSTAFHSSSIALLESEPHQHAFRVVAVTAGAHNWSTATDPSKRSSGALVFMNSLEQAFDR
jgi:hypothetical protein